MRVLVTGAYGLIGSAILARLHRNGHELVASGRSIGEASRRMPFACWIEADFNELTDAAAWAPLLDGVDSVVNCVGVLAQGGRDDIQRTHVAGTIALFDACARVDLRRVIHISAIGASTDGKTDFARTKAQADAYLATLDLDWMILRPALVLAPAAYGGTAMLRALAAFPLFLPGIAGVDRIQVVDVDDPGGRCRRCHGNGFVLFEIRHAGKSNMGGGASPRSRAGRYRCSASRLAGFCAGADGDDASVGDDCRKLLRHVGGMARLAQPCASDGARAAFCWRRGRPGAVDAGDRHPAERACGHSGATAIQCAGALVRAALSAQAHRDLGAGSILDCNRSGGAQTRPRLGDSAACRLRLSSARSRNDGAARRLVRRRARRASAGAEVRARRSDPDAVRKAALSAHRHHSRATALGRSLGPLTKIIPMLVATALTLAIMDER